MILLLARGTCKNCFYILHTVHQTTGLFSTPPQLILHGFLHVLFFARQCFVSLCCNSQHFTQVHLNCSQGLIMLMLYAYFIYIHTHTIFFSSTRRMWSLVLILYWTLQIVKTWQWATPYSLKPHCAWCTFVLCCVRNSAINEVLVSRTFITCTTYTTLVGMLYKYKHKDAVICTSFQSCI